MLKEMAGISLDSMLVKWYRISKVLMHGRMVGFKVLRIGLGHIARNCTARQKRRDAVYLQTDEIKEVNANCILMANLQQASTSGTQHDKAPVYDTDGSAE
nr:hypothetical protein [Tanacetum cinerariifolium]